MASTPCVSPWARCCCSSDWSGCGRARCGSPALVGAGIATGAVLAAGAWLRKPLSRIPETELKWGVGVLLSAFGVFFLAEGLHVDWPGGDAAVLYLVATLAFLSQMQAHQLARTSTTA
jgi:Ca2+/H+ antiporter, TMEM165/GDT1 family